MISALFIDAIEQLGVVVFDVPGGYLPTDMPVDKQILLHIRDEFANTMCEVNPDYKPYVQYENGKNFLYVKVLRAIYVCIDFFLLWYNFYVNTLKYLGFSINIYDNYVSNKMIDEN